MISSLINRDILLDTCVIQYLGSDIIKKEVDDILKRLIANNNRLTVSYYTVYELLRGADYQTDQKRREILKNFRIYQITPKVLIWASLLNTFYRDCGVHSGINDGDEMLAATAINLRMPIITTNGEHFPRPFFDGSKEIIEYARDSRRSKIMALYFLEPDIEFIKNKIREWKL